MKKTLTLLLLAAMLTAPLAGCGTTDDTPAQTTEGADNGTDDNIPEYNPADANPASDFEYEVNKDGGITITKYIGTDTDVVIPEKIEGKNVTVIGNSAMAKNALISSVRMNDSVTQIEDYAFFECFSLSTVVLSSQLLSIGNSAFQNCTQLSNIDLPETLTNIGGGAFLECAALKHVRIPANALGLDSMAAFASSGLETVELAEGLQILPVSVFYQTQIKEIIVPSSVSIIQTNALGECSELETVTLNKGLTTIELFAFAEDHKLTAVVIPDTVTSVTPYSFDNCTGLEKLYFEGNAPDGFIGTKDATFTIYYHEGAEGFTTPEWNGYKTEIW